MARRRPSAFEDLLTIASKLPWSISIALSVVSLVGFHWAAAAFAVTSAANPADLGSTVIHQGIHVGAFFFQFVVPPAFAIGAIVSYLKRSRSTRLLNGVRVGLDVSVLTWQEFEILIAEGFRQQGFSVNENGGPKPDGGVDLVLNRGNERFLVQCKQWRAQQVPVAVVRELYGVMAADRAAGGYVVTSGRFTRDAVAFAQGRNIDLIDGTRLHEVLGQARPSTWTNSRPSTTKAAVPSCPRCREPMIARVATRGPNSGKEFWGCRRYPKCREILAKA